jgi:signal transduction histidine kinase
MRQISTTYVAASSSGHTEERTECGPQSKNADRIDNLVHDLRQPLSIIESIAYYLEMMSSDPSVASHLQHIQKMVGETHRILEQASAPQAH